MAGVHRRGDFALHPTVSEAAGDNDPGYALEHGRVAFVHCVRRDPADVDSYVVVCSRMVERLVHAEVCVAKTDVLAFDRYRPLRAGESVSADKIRGCAEGRPLRLQIQMTHL